MRKFKKIAACAAAVMCAAAMTVSASAKVTVVPSSGYVKSEEKQFLVMLYSDGTYDKNYGKDETDYGIDLTKIASVEVTVKAENGFSGDMGGGFIMSSKSKDDPSSHNWPQKEYWGVTDDTNEIYTRADNKPVIFETVGDLTYKAELKLDDKSKVIDNYDFVQFAFADWGGDTVTVQSIVMKDADGNELISFDKNGKASLENVWGKEKAEETTVAETEAPEETTAAEETTEKTKKTKKTTEEVVEEEIVEEEDSDEDTTGSDEDDDEVDVDLEEEDDVEEDDDAEDDDAAEDEDVAEPFWVGAEEGSGTEIIAPWLSFEKLAGVPSKPCLILCSEDDNAEPPADAELDFKVSDIYGFRFYVQVDQTAWDNWHGGQVGTNSALGGWTTLVDYSTGNDLGNLDIDLDAGTFTYMSDTPLFAQDEQDMGGYAHIWLMDWSNGDDALVTVGVDVLDKDGNNLFDAPAAVVEEAPVVEETPVVVEEAPVVTTGDVAAATDSSKGSPDTGVADVAVVAGLGLVAAGAVVVAKKRK